MRIVKREEFLSLPTPFMYVECDKDGNTKGELTINCSNIPENNDWIYNSCKLEPDFHDSEERWISLDRMLKDSTLSIPICDNNTSRDGCYDEDGFFIIYSKEDFQIFVTLMQKYLAIYGENKVIKYDL